MSLQSFRLAELDSYLMEGQASPRASTDFRLLYVGRDNVHDALKYVISRVTVSFYCNMFGYDDDELNSLLMQLVNNPAVTCLITLDKSQAGGVHEKRLLDSDAAKDPEGFRTHFVIGQSATHQISHTKGFVADSLVGAEGSTNWSTSGEGTFVIAGKPGGANFKAQNNTQSFFTCPDAVSRFQAELITEHVSAQRQMSKLP